MALPNTELDWFRKYLTDRRQLVGFGQEISDPCPITSGVPQGPIPVGPLLFVLFVNVLHYSSRAMSDSDVC